MIGIYARQSIDKKDSISIESQIEFCKKEFAENEPYKTYIDKGFSGKDTNRPAFEEMINDIKAGIIKKVIVYKLDRISRSTLDFANIIDTFKKHDVDFISSTEKFDTSTPIGKAMLHIIMVFAELERETIQKRITDNYYTRGRKGLFLGGTIPYGFLKKSTQINNVKTSVLVENVEQSIHLIKMYELYATTNMSLGQISDYLNENNIPSAQNKKWDSCKVSRILRSPLYVKADADVYMYYKNKGCIISNELSDFIGTNGCYLFGKRNRNERKYTDVKDHILVIAPHKGLVDSKIWLACQYKLDKNKQIKNSGKGKHSWLSGLVKCGYCNYAVSVVVSDRGRYKYFNCRGKTNLKICKGHSKPIVVDEVENIIEGYLLEKIKELNNVNLIMTTEDANINQLKLQIMEIDRQIENLISQMAEANNVVMKYINEKIMSLDNTKKILLEEMKINTLINSNSIPVDQIIEKVTNWYNLPLEDKKEVCKCFINKILLKDDEIIIDWKT